MNSACPCPAGDQSTRQWLTRSAIVPPPSFERRMNEFSPVMTTSWGSTIWGSAISVSSSGRSALSCPQAQRNSKVSPSRCQALAVGVTVRNQVWYAIGLRALKARGSSTATQPPFSGSRTDS